MICRICMEGGSDEDGSECGWYDFCTESEGVYGLFDDRIMGWHE